MCIRDSEATRSPDETATLFLRSVRAIRWGTVAQFLDAEALERFQFTVTMIANADSSGELREYLVQSDSTGMSDLSAFEVFERSINAVIDDMPGLMHSLYDRDDSVIGSVREEGGVAHTVYRTLARISGAVPEVKVMQLRSTPEGWRVAWSDELEVIEAALRGVGRCAHPTPDWFYHSTGGTASIRRPNASSSASAPGPEPVYLPNLTTTSP